MNCKKCEKRKRRKTYLVKVIQSSMQIGMHACRRFIGDFDGIFQNSLNKRKGNEEIHICN